MCLTVDVCIWKVIISNALSSLDQLKGRHTHIRLFENISVVLWNWVSVNKSRDQGKLLVKVWMYWNFLAYFIWQFLCLLKLFAVLFWDFSHIFTFFLMLEYFFLDFFLTSHTDLFVAVIDVCPLPLRLMQWLDFSRYVFWVHIYRIVYILYWIFLCSGRSAVTGLPCSDHHSSFYKKS